MPIDLSEQLIVAISSRALFNLDACHAIYENEGVKDYADHQIQHENDILEPGNAFQLAKKLSAIRDPKTNDPLVEVILISRNSADTGLRIFNSIQHYKLPITRAVFSNGESPYRYVSAFHADLFLSANPEDVQQGLLAGYAAATILPGAQQENSSAQLRIAFDGDSVLFSDEAERVYQSEGLARFSENETNAAKKPLADGPLKGFLTALHAIQTRFPFDESPLRTALVTARSAPAHERVIRTFRAWDIRIDEALFLGGVDKSEFLKAFGADIFFDDQSQHCESARQHVSTAHVPHGVMNED